MSTGAAKEDSRRSKATRAATVSSTVDNAVKQEGTMADQEKRATSSSSATQSAKASKADEVDKASNGSNGSGEFGLALRRPDSQDSIQVAEQFSSSGIRPVTASTLEIYGMILNNRPIAASHLHVLNYDIPGHRPVFASNIVVRDDLVLPGGRPIVASDPSLMQPSYLPGGRPVASNQIDDSETLMGFID
jgi:hypothetical protein